MRFVISSNCVNIVGLLKCVIHCSPDAIGYIGENGGGRDRLTVLFAGPQSLVPVIK